MICSVVRKAENGCYIFKEIKCKANNGKSRIFRIKKGSWRFYINNKGYYLVNEESMNFELLKSKKNIEDILNEVLKWKGIDDQYGRSESEITCLCYTSDIGVNELSKIFFESIRNSTLEEFVDIVYQTEKLRIIMPDNHPSRIYKEKDLVYALHQLDLLMDYKEKGEDDQSVTIERALEIARSIKNIK